MGKIKSKPIKRYSQELSNSGIDFSEDFEKNKRILGSEMPSKKMRNQMAGYLSRFMKNRNSEKQKLKAE